LDAENGISYEVISKVSKGRQPCVVVVERAGNGNGAVTKVVVIAFRYCSAELGYVDKISLYKEKRRKEKIARR
jgi:hypothetical protein